MSGLDDLVADAMKRKLIPTNDKEADVIIEAVKETVLKPKTAPVSEKSPEPEPKLNSTGGITPDVSLVFLVNGVRCILTVHVQAGATVEIATEPTAKPPKRGVKVKGVRGATTEEPEAPEASETLFDQSKPIGGDNLPEGWVMDPVVGATLAVEEPSVANIDNAPLWVCPDHGKREEKKSGVTGRMFTVCPECGKLAPR